MTDRTISTQVLLPAAGVNPLHRAAQEGDLDRVMQYLLSRPLFQYGVDSTDSVGQTPLFYACSEGHEEVVRMLVSDFAADISIQDNHGRTAIFIAASNGYSKVVEALIDECNPLSMKDHSILHHVCSYGNVTLVRKLLCKGVDVNYRDLVGQTPLFYACKKGHKEVARMLASEFAADISVQDDHGRTALWIAASSGHNKVVEALMDECNPLNMGDHTILHLVCAYGDIALVRKMVCKGIDVNYKDSEGQTPLFHACRRRHLGVVQTLVAEYQADVAAQDNNGRTAAMVAASNGCASVVGWLVDDCKVSLFTKDHNGATIFHHACAGGNANCLQNLFSNSFTNYADFKDFMGQTPLFYACKMGHVHVTLTLLHQFNVDVTIRDNLGRTAAMVAVLNGQDNFIPKLVKVHAKDNRGQTLLHYACEVGNVTLVENLITKYRADVNAQDDENNTPLHKAASAGKQHVFTKLLYRNIISLEHRDQLGRTLLHIACTGNHVGLIKTLINVYKADFNSLDLQGNTPIHVAALKGNDDVVFMLIKDFKCDIYDKGQFGRTLLHSACIGGNLNLFRALVIEFKDVASIKDDQNNTPLHVAACSGNRDITLVLISKFKCDPNSLGHLGRTLLHSACIGGNSSLVQTLIDHYNAPLLVVDSNGDTPLHTAATLGHCECLEILLSQGAPLLVRNSSGKTSLDVATKEARILLNAHMRKGKDMIYRQYDAIEESAKKIYAGAQRITRIFVIGNPGVGKSTLIETLKRDGWFDYFRTVSESSVPPHTAGIILSIYKNKQCGRILFYDFAGDPEYYSSHAAILESFTSSKKGYNIFVIVVDLREDVKSFQRIINYWTLFIQNQSFPKNNLSFIFVGSHLDTQSNQQKIHKCQKFRKACQHVNLNENSCFMLNCCRPQSSGATNVWKHIISVTKDSPCYQLSLQSSVLLGLLEKDFSQVISCSIQTLLTHIKDTGISLPNQKEPLLSILNDLQDIGRLLIIPTTQKSTEVQIVLNLSRLTNEVHQLLFSKQALDRLGSTDDEEVSSSPSFNIGIIPEELLFSNSETSQPKKIIPLPKFITKECLIQLQYCQEIRHDDVHAFLPVPSNSSGQSYLFFPALCTAKKHEIDLWNDPPEVKYSQGWLAWCTSLDDYFPPRFLHVLLLRLVFKFTLSAKHSASLPDYSVFQRRCCQMWSTGVFWSMRQGVKCIVELVRDSKAVVVLAKSDNDSPKNFTKYFNEVITCVKETQLYFCRHIKPEIFLLDSTKELDYFNPTHMYRMTDIEEVLENPEDMEVLHSVAENKAIKVSKLQMLFTRVPSHQKQGPEQPEQTPSASNQVFEVETKPVVSFQHNPTRTDFTRYVSSLPPAARPHLEYQLDWDNDVERDLRQLAHHMLNWDVELSTHLGLTEVDISDIKHDYPKAKLQRRAALKLWKDHQVPHATYGNLLQVFIDAGHTRCAEELCQLLRSKNKDAVSV